MTEAEKGQKCGERATLLSAIGAALKRQCSNYTTFTVHSKGGGGRKGTIGHLRLCTIGPKPGPKSEEGPVCFRISNKFYLKKCSKFQFFSLPGPLPPPKANYPDSLVNNE